MNSNSHQEDAQVHVLTWSTNRGRYCFDDPTGQDVTSGDRLAIEVQAGVWVEGCVEHSSSYEHAGCYAICDWGKAGQARRPENPVAASMQQPHDLYRGYYFCSLDGRILGLCTGMRVRPC